MKNKFSLLLFVLIIVCWIMLNPLFAIVKKITIVGNKNITEDEIVQTSELLGNLVFFYNKNSFKKKLKENIMIKNIHLSLLSYSEVKIEIIERMDNENINLKIICGKGCYVRSLARDLGNELGCFAHAKNIRRTEYGPFNLKKCVHLDALENFKDDDLKANIISISILLKDYPNFECATENLNIISNGKKNLTHKGLIILF